MKLRLLHSLIGQSLQSYLPARFTSEHLFIPTTGRWLWNESQQLQRHTLRFDVTALKHVVANIAGLEGQSNDVKVKKLAEGASNKVMTATVGRQRYIVKVPDPLVPRRLVTASEVATLEFLRAELELPVPKVLAWSDSDDNAVGCEYIIMEEAAGHDLKTTWPALGLGQRTEVVDQIIAIQERLIQASKAFRGYGSLYFTSDAQKFKFRRQIDLSSTKSSRFIIGPLAHEHFMEPVLSKTGIDNGPWHTSRQYIDSIARSSLLQIKRRAGEGSNAVNSRPFSFPIKPISDLSPAAVCQMLEALCRVSQHVVPQSADQCLPLLWHPDLHDGNIFVSEEGKVTCIIDWQDANVLPLFLSLRKPQFLDVADNALLFELPKDLKEMSPSVRSETWDRFNKSMLQGYYLAYFRENIPAVSAIYDDKKINPIRRQMANYARTSDGHDANALMLRSTLLQIRKNWTRLAGGDGTETAPPCPIDFDEEQLAKLYEDGRRFNRFRDILEASDVCATFPLEGWVPVDLFYEWRRGLKKAVRDVIETLENQEERDEFQERLRLWNLTD